MRYRIEVKGEFEGEVLLGWRPAMCGATFESWEEANLALEHVLLEEARCDAREAGIDVDVDVDVRFNAPKFRIVEVRYEGKD